MKFGSVVRPCTTTPWLHIDGLAQDRSNSIANALELLQFCTNPSIWCDAVFVYQNGVNSAYQIITKYYLFCYIRHFLLNKEFVCHTWNVNVIPCKILLRETFHRTRRIIVNNRYVLRSSLRIYLRYIVSYFFWCSQRSITSDPVV